MTADTLRAWVEIDIDAFIHNLGVAKKLTGTKVMAVVKGNAHGHGAVKASLALEAHGADAFAVACMSEAIELPGGWNSGTYPGFGLDTSRMRQTAG